MEIIMKPDPDRGHNTMTDRDAVRIALDLYGEAYRLQLAISHANDRDYAELAEQITELRALLRELSATLRRERRPCSRESSPSS